MESIHMYGQHAAAQAVLRVRALGIPFTLVATALSGAFRGLLDTRTPLLVVLVTNAINFSLDVVLIFGSQPLHVPPFGAPGAAAATVVAEAAAVVALLAALARTRVFPRRLGFAGLAQLREFAGAGSAVLLRTAALQTTLLLGTATVAHAAHNSSADVAAHQVRVRMRL
jgi:Na+-driven multidrug efflux pump